MKRFKMLLALAVASLIFAGQAYAAEITAPKGWTKQNVSGMKFYISPADSPEDTFSENINIVHQKLLDEDVTYEQLIKVTVDGIKKMDPNYKLISKEKVKLAGVDAYKIVQQFSINGKKFNSTQYYVKKDGHCYCITCTALPSTAKKYAPIFEKAIKTFKF